MVRRIVERFHPERIILFGSHARGTAGSHSDVDLLVVMQPQGSKRRRAVEIHGLLAGIGVPKDVIVVTPEEFDAYRDAPGTVIRTAWHEGKILMTMRPKDEDLVRAWVLKAEHDLLNIENNLAARDIPVVFMRSNAERNTSKLSLFLGKSTLQGFMI